MPHCVPFSTELAVNTFLTVNTFLYSLACDTVRKNIVRKLASSYYTSNNVRKQTDIFVYKTPPIMKVIRNMRIRENTVKFPTHT